MYFDKQIGTKNFWVDVSGKIYKCGGHEQFAKQLFPNSPNPLHTMYKSGHIKVVVESELAMFVHFLYKTTISPSQYKSLNLISNEYGFDGQFREIPEVLSENISVKYKDFYKV